MFLATIFVLLDPTLVSPAGASRVRGRLMSGSPFYFGVGRLELCQSCARLNPTCPPWREQGRPGLRGGAPPPTREARTGVHRSASAGSEPAQEGAVMRARRFQAIGASPPGSSHPGLPRGLSREGGSVGCQRAARRRARASQSTPFIGMVLPFLPCF